MGEFTEQLELRWQRMKEMRARSMKFAEMVAPLKEAGLLECRNCEKGIPKIRKTRKGLEVCATCEDTIATQWRLNIDRLKLDEATAAEVKFEWLEAHRTIVRRCEDNWKQVVVITTTKRTYIEPIDGQTWRVKVKRASGEEEIEISSKDIVGVANVVSVITREETRIYPELMRLMLECEDKMAKMAGLDVDEPLPDKPPERKKLNVYERTEQPDGDGAPN